MRWAAGPTQLAQASSPRKLPAGETSQKPRRFAPGSFTHSMSVDLSRRLACVSIKKYPTIEINANR